MFININTLYIYKLKVRSRGSKKYNNLGNSPSRT